MFPSERVNNECISLGGGNAPMAMIHKTECPAEETRDTQCKLHIQHYVMVLAETHGS